MIVIVPLCLNLSNIFKGAALFKQLIVVWINFHLPESIGIGIFLFDII